MSLRDHVVVSIQEMKFLRFGSGCPVSDIRHLSDSRFLHDHSEFSTLCSFNVSSFIENSAQLNGAHARYNVVWGSRSHA